MRCGPVLSVTQCCIQHVRLSANSRHSHSLLPHMHHDVFSALANYLNASGLNYSVFLRLYKVSHGEHASSNEVITAALGEQTVIGNCIDVTSEEALSEIRESLSYAGDDSAGPAPSALKSERFATLLASVLAESASIASQAKLTQNFWLNEGHPAYPVFWDFAFLFRGINDSAILIGSSSD